MFFDIHHRIQQTGHRAGRGFAEFMTSLCSDPLSAWFHPDRVTRGRKGNLVALEWCLLLVVMDIPQVSSRDLQDHQDYLGWKGRRWGLPCESAVCLSIAWPVCCSHRWGLSGITVCFVFFVMVWSVTLDVMWLEILHMWTTEVQNQEWKNSSLLWPRTGTKVVTAAYVYAECVRVRACMRKKGGGLMCAWSRCLLAHFSILLSNSRSTQGHAGIKWWHCPGAAFATCAGWKTVSANGDHPLVLMMETMWILRLTP